MSELKSKRVGRGDLLRWAVANRNAYGFEAGVVALGFELGEELEISTSVDTSKNFQQQKLQPTLELFAPPTSSNIRNIDRDMPSALIVESVEQLPPTGEVSLIPASQAGDEQWVQLPNDVSTVQSEPLMPWNELAPKLKKLTSTIAKAGVDLPEFSRLVSLGKVVRSLPSKQRRRQLGRTHLWLDCANHLRPYFSDMASIVFPLIAQRARGEITVTNIDLPHGQPVNALSGEVLLTPRKVRPGDQVLVLGDANSLLVNSGSNSAGRWVNRALNIRRCGARVQLLHPMPNARLGQGIRGNFETLSWVAKHTLPLSQSALAATPLDYLLMLASPFVRVEPHLLRALRIELAACADPSLESEFYQHQHVASDCDAAWVLSEHRVAYFELLMQQGTQTLLIKLARLAHHHHLNQRPIIWAEEIGLFAQLAESLESQTEEASDVDTQWFTKWVNKASKGKQAVARLVFKKGGGQNKAESSVEASISERFAARLIGRKAHLDIVDEADKQFQTVHAASSLRRDGILGAIQGFDSALLSELMKGSVQQSPIAIRLYQKGRYLIFVRADRSDGSKHFGRLLCTFSATHLIHIEVAGKHTKSLTVESLLPDGDNFSKDCFFQPPIGGNSSTHITIDTGLERITLRNIVWPVATRPVAAMRTKGGIIISAFGVDHQYGTYFDLTIGENITQRFIWIAPGAFNMGSPQDELGRDDDEGPQHKVVLTQGFWMADTACSQAFWSTLMLGENPSHFKGNLELPVESVSWDDTQKLLEVLAIAMTDAGLELVPALPTEAQWEYACRAGTEGPFNTGSTITSEQANFDGQRPYREGEGKGTFRNSTVPVKSFKPNDWGLHQMHGNVWEWCDDGRRKYTTELVTNPGDRFLNREGGLGRVADSVRAFRGGSWYGDARFVRSAHRNANHRVIRSRILGLRLVLRFAGLHQVGEATGGRGRLTESTRGAERLTISARDARDKNKKAKN
jgi:formylglycine-generating enzyme required for sulfatase activity